MHPALSAFPSARFYGGRLLDGVAPGQRPPPPFPMPPLRAQPGTGGGAGAGDGGGGPLMFVDVEDGREEVSQVRASIPSCSLGLRTPSPTQHLAPFSCVPTLILL